MNMLSVATSTDMKASPGDFAVFILHWKATSNAVGPLQGTGSCAVPLTTEPSGDAKIGSISDGFTSLRVPELSAVSG
jgi:hypothetical protein